MQNVFVFFFLLKNTVSCNPFENQIRWWMLTQVANVGVAYFGGDSRKVDKNPSASNKQLYLWAPDYLFRYSTAEL